MKTMIQLLKAINKSKRAVWKKEQIVDKILEFIEDEGEEK